MAAEERVDGARDRSTRRRKTKNKVAAAPPEGPGGAACVIENVFGASVFFIFNTKGVRRGPAAASRRHALLREWATAQAIALKASNDDVTTANWLMTASSPKRGLDQRPQRRPSMSSLLAAVSPPPRPLPKRRRRREQNRIAKHQRVHRRVDVPLDAARSRRRELLAAARARGSLRSPVPSRKSIVHQWRRLHGSDTAQASGLPQGTHVTLEHVLRTFRAPSPCSCKQ